MLGDSALTSASRASTISGRRRRSASTSAGEPFGIGIILRVLQRRAFGASNEFRPQVLSAPTMPRERRAWNHQAGVTDLQTATSKLSSELAASAAATALSAVDQAGVEIRLLDSVAEFEAASRLIGRIWSDDDAKAPPTLLRALSHAGNFVAGAFSERKLVGISIGFFGQDGDELHLHSHITGVDPRLQNKSLGFALKQFQRSWALEHGAASVRWTADPLVRRNLYFNLCKLGASVVDYYPDFYGPLLDGVNGAGASDRVLLHWELASPSRGRGRRPASARAGGAARSGHRLPRRRRLSARTAPSGAETLLVWIPDDIVELRQSDPGQARRLARSRPPGDRRRPRRRLPRRGDHARRLAPPDAMKIEAVELRRISIPMISPFRVSFGVEHQRDILLVHVVGTETEGWGECVAMSRPLYSAEYTDGAEDVMRRHLLPRLFEAGDVAADQVAEILRPLHGHPMAKAALEMAILDAELRAAGVSLADLPRSSSHRGRLRGLGRHPRGSGRARRGRRRLSRGGLPPHQAQDRARP